ncbi:MAG: nucleotide exchange factor GrpE [Candidatus Omnitrophota bacterium]|nr:MAG: nucleotide exchange factor GrpE [Candidatus Omnitrophota bacterium]
MSKTVDNKQDQQHSKETEHTEQEMVNISLEEYEALKNKEIQVTGNLMRMQADFDNSRKRMERDRVMFLKFANEEIIAELIPFIDDFQRAFSAADKTKDFDLLHKGVEMILNHLMEFLKHKGVTAIEALGNNFDPNYHEAMLQIETDQYPENTVVEELEKGYLLNNKILRTAKVKVAKSITVQPDCSNQQNEEDIK